MRIYLWLVMGEGFPTIAVACADPHRMEAAIAARFEAMFGFLPQACCGAHTRDEMERHLFGLGYTQITQVMTELDEGTNNS